MLCTKQKVLRRFWYATLPVDKLDGGPKPFTLLGEKIAVGFSGLAEFEGQIEDGELRVLAVSGEERLPQDTFADIPTLTESGIDLVFLNWRGVLAPPRQPQLVPRPLSAFAREPAAA